MTPPITNHFTTGRERAMNEIQNKLGQRFGNNYSGAFAEGIAAARKKGSSIVDNPYPPNSQEWLDWKMGGKKQFESSQGLKGV